VNEPTWLAQATAYIVDNYLIVSRFADWSNPIKTGTLTALLIVLCYFLWLKSLDAQTAAGRTTWRAAVVLVGFNVGLIALFAVERWT
jgi:hypothetical protein